MNRASIAVRVFAIAIAVVWAGCATLPATTPIASPETRAILAPHGELRVGLYRGSPSSIVEDAGGPRGVGYDLGRALAARLGVAFVPVVFANNPATLDAVRTGDVDVVFTNASPARARDMDFSPGFLDVGKSFLVPSGSPLATLADMKRPRLRIGVSAGSSTAGEIAPLYPDAMVVPTPTLKAGVEMLGRGDIDAFATNKAILFEMSDALPGSRVLDGSWGLEYFAVGIPKGRDAARPIVAAFIADAQRDGTVARAVARAGLRGTIAP